MKQDIFQYTNGTMTYCVQQQEKPVSGIVKVPGSKSMTNRALLLAALANQKVKLNGVLFSDDSRHFLCCLELLGYEINIDESLCTVTIKGTGGEIPNKTGIIDVGSAGTAARFLTALLALSDGEYEIQCSEQMKKRPMEPLFRALTKMGASFDYLEKEYYLPVKLKGNRGKCENVTMDISKSTQFLSALIMVAPITKNGLAIKITSEKKDGSYIRITRKMLEQFGVKAEFDGNTYYIKGNQHINVEEYNIEPDVSAACYFYAIAAITGGKITVKNIFLNSMQGDMKFLGVLRELGCMIEETDAGVCVTGPKNGIYKGIDVDMNDFSDQTMTLASIAPFATTDTIIRNVSHIRGQECNRMEAIINELQRAGVACEADGENIRIHPSKVLPANIETYNDHRVAMAFTVMGIRAKGIVIKNPLCCKKTFENYYEVLNDLLHI